MSKEMFANDFFESIDYDISSTMFELYDHSQTLPEGPVYKCIITVHKGNAKIKFYWENKPISSIDEIALDTNGNIPVFAYRKYFSEALIERSDKYSLAIGQPALVEGNIQSGKDVPSHHMEIYALYDWISDTNNGGFDQYFSRKITWSNAQLPRKNMYPLVRLALKKIEHPTALPIYDEAVALYAHLHTDVEQARIKMDIPAVTKVEESDIRSRYYEMLESLETAISDYIKSNKDIFAYHQ